VDAGGHHHLLGRAAHGAHAAQIVGNRLPQRAVAPSRGIAHQIPGTRAPLPVLDAGPGLQGEFAHVRDAGHEGARLAVGEAQARYQPASAVRQIVPGCGKRGGRVVLVGVDGRLQQIEADVFDIGAAPDPRIHVAFLGQLVVDLQDRIARNAQLGRQVARRRQARTCGQAAFQNGSTDQSIQAMISRTIIAGSEVLLQPFRENECFQIGPIKFTEMDLFDKPKDQYSEKKAERKHPPGQETSMTQRNQDWQARKNAAVPDRIGIACDFYAERASNAELWDVEGRRYIDFAAGIAVANTGHRHPRLVEAVRAQLDAFTHTAFQVAPYGSYVELAERINRLTPGDHRKKTAFFTTGAEALENAVKIARAATGRTGIVAFSGAFHGRTFMGMALTGKVAPYKQDFGPLPAEVYHIPFPSRLDGITVQDSLRALDLLFKADISPNRVAAIVIEPVQGEGGFNVAPPELLRALRERCDAHGILLIVDEVQTGFARTGRMFAIEHSNVTPDLITMAKSLAGGMPLSGVCGRAELMDAAPRGSLGGTYA